MTESLQPILQKGEVSLKPEDIFIKHRACLVDSLDLQGTTLGEKFVEKKLLSESQLNSLQVKHQDFY